MLEGMSEADIIVFRRSKDATLNRCILTGFKLKEETGLKALKTLQNEEILISHSKMVSPPWRCWMYAIRDVAKATMIVRECLNYVINPDTADAVEESHTCPSSFACAK